MKIYYIYHSCFVVETNTSYLIFDYYKFKNNEGDFEFMDLLNNILNSNKLVYIFASHSHSDHYNSKILTWSQNRENIYYIISDDIKVYQNIKHLFYISENQEFKINNVIIKTFSSTDAGISFLVNIDNVNIFHAGDLNWWKWNDDTKSEEEEMESAFKNIIKTIISTNTYIDVAFFPVDPRLEENYFCGGDYFIDMFQPNFFVPMHFDDDYKIIDDFIQSQSMKNINTKIFKITHPNQLLFNQIN